MAKQDIVKDDPPAVETSFSFGIVFDVNGTAVPISAADVANAKEKGLKLELPAPVVLGSFQNLLDWLREQFDVSLPSGDLPQYISDIVDKIASMEFTVSVFVLEIPPAAASEGTKFAIEIAGVFPGESLKPIPGFPLGIKGGVFGATNIAPAIT